MEAIRTHRGFTLLEVMVALVIFAICAATLAQQSGRSTRQAIALEQRMTANWIAENELERLRLTGYPKEGKKTQEITYAKQLWQVESDVTSTNDADLRRVVVSVSLSQEAGLNSAPNTGDETGSNRYRLTGFLGRY